MNRITIDDVYRHCLRQIGRYNNNNSLLLFKEIIEQLKEYQNLEEQGRLVKLPLEAYCIVDFEIHKGLVLEAVYHLSRKPLFVIRYDDNFLTNHKGYLGNSVFLTKEKAEEKLKEMRGETE